MTRHNPDDGPREIARPPVDKRVEKELEFHIEMRTRELMARGVPPAEARRQASERFGDLAQLSAELDRLERATDRAKRRTRYLGELSQDGRFALRILVRRRSFAAIAIVTLALGIGAATAIYSVVDRVLLRPLPFREPHRIAAVWITNPGVAKDPTISRLAEHTPMGNREYQALRKNATRLQDVAMWSSGGARFADGPDNQIVSVIRATSSLLATLRVQVTLGRSFQPGEDVLNGPNVAMVSWEAWQTRYGGDSTVIGRAIRLDDKPFMIVGVLPRGLRLDRTTEAAVFWLPALRDSSDIPERHNRGYMALARLAPGATFESATQETARIVRDVTADTAISARVEEWQRDQGRDAKGPLVLLLAASGLLLLIACVNVALLQLGEAAGRARELAARAALGAGAGRLVRQLLVESLVIGTLGSVLGSVLAWWMIRGLVAIAPDRRIPGIDTVALDGRVLAFAAAMAAITGLLFGIVPALLAGRAGAASLVRSGAGQTGRDTRRAQRTLVASQLAISMVLLSGAALLGRSLAKLTSVNPGFNPDHLSAVSPILPRRFSDEQTIAFTAEVIRRLETLPGVEGVTAASQPPFVGGTSSSPIQVEALGDVAPPARNTLQRSVVPGYFETLGIRLLAGRTFRADDRVGSEPVAIMSAAAARRDFGRQSPLGRRVKHQGEWRRIVGVVGDVKYRGLGRDDEPSLYVPFDQFATDPFFVVRGPIGPALEPAFKRIVRELEPRAVARSPQALSALIEGSYAAERYRTMLVSMFGAMAALLAAVGLYGVSVRAAARRTREIGIRLALGGTPRMVRRVLIGDAMTSVVIGLAVGIPGELLAERLVAPYLYGVGPSDPVSFAVVAVLLVAVTALASFIPARAASDTDPSAVLRSD